MPTLLYHKDVYAPRNIFRGQSKVRLQYSAHARKAAAEDRYGDLTQYLQEWFTIFDEELVEVEMVDGVVTKRVVRRQVTTTLDVVYVITADNRVKTVWGNLHSDRHATLDKSKFVLKPVSIKAH